VFAISLFKAYSLKELLMNIAKVKIKFSYTERVIPPRCRNARDQRFHDGEVVVDVREVSREEAPVALIQTRNDYSGKPLEPAEYRWFEGQFWSNKAVEFRFGEPNDPPLAGVVDARDDGVDRTPTSPRRATRLQMVEMFESQASSYVVINGERWEPVGEPRYYVDDSSLHGTYVTVAHSFERHSHRERFFSLKQYAEARSLAERMNRERRREDVDVMPGDQFQIVMPGTIRVNEQEQVEITVFGLRNAGHSGDRKRAEHHLLEVRIRVPKDALEARDHLEVASRKMQELHDHFPEAVFDENSPAGRVIMELREQIAALVAEKASRLSGTTDASVQDLDI
jgi:hypothetical protein